MQRSAVVSEGVVDTAGHPVLDDAVFVCDPTTGWEAFLRQMDMGSFTCLHIWVRVVHTKGVRGTQVCTSVDSEGQRKSSSFVCPGIDPRVRGVEVGPTLRPLSPGPLAAALLSCLLQTCSLCWARMTTLGKKNNNDETKINNKYSKRTADYKNSKKHYKNRTKNKQASRRANKQTIKHKQHSQSCIVLLPSRLPRCWLCRHYARDARLPLVSCRVPGRLHSA